MGVSVDVMGVSVDVMGVNVDVMGVGVDVTGAGVSARRLGLYAGQRYDVERLFYRRKGEYSEDEARWQVPIRKTLNNRPSFERTVVVASFG
eukprot:1114414-Pyramimonas_sp.AAC.3